MRRSVADPAADARVNVEGTINVLAAAHAAGARRVVYSATGGAVYGEAEQVPTPEDAPAQPLAPYGQAKLAGEGYCALFARLHGLSTIALRYANVYGPRQDPLGEGGVIAIFCGCLAEGRTPTIYGDGEQTRDYVYVGDVVEANLRAADARRDRLDQRRHRRRDLGARARRAFRGLGGGAALRAASTRRRARARCCAAASTPRARASARLGAAHVPLADGLRRTLDHVAAGAR